MKLLKHLSLGSLCLLMLSSGFGQVVAPLPATTPWDIEALSQSSPVFHWLDQDQPRKVRPLTYAGESYQGNPTRVFAWYASPSTLETDTESKSFPGIVLVHGGGGTAFAEWAELWARRGYAAIAMDLAGCGEGRQRMPDGGPGQSDQEKFRAIDGPITDQWTYHAVANVIRAHSLLLSMDEVKGQKTALTGISWGGYLTCIVAGLDPRFEVAMPVYGCGYLRDNSVWVESQFKKMAPNQVERWHQLWDPSQYLGAARMPVMFLNGTEDFAYPMDSYARTCALVRGEKNYSIQLHMRHGHLFKFPEFFGFIDQYILGTTPMPVVSKPWLRENQVHAEVDSPTPLTSARLHYTTGPHRENSKRAWTSVDLQVNGMTVHGQAPPPTATVWYVDVTDTRNLQVSSEIIIPSTPTPETKPDADDVTRVFIFAGQSNMAGSDAHADRIDQYPDYRGSGQPQTNVLFSYLLERDATASNGWVPLGPTRYFGSELTFAKSLKKHGYERVAIIKSAVGGTTLFKDWNPDAPEEGLQLYPKTLNLVQESLAALDEKGIPWRLEAVLWHQGENDMLNRQEFMKYGQRLKPFIARLRQDLEIPELKFFIGEISEKGIWGMDHRPFVSAVKVQQLQVAEQDEKTWFVPTSHLAFEVMNSGQPHYHFGTQGQLQLGDALAEAWLETMGTKTARNQNTYGETLPLDSDKKVRLFILAGQRNMEGEDAFISELNSLKGTPPTWKAPDSTVYRYSLGGGVRKSLDWAELSAPEYLGNFGPELSMGKRLRYLTDDGIAMVKFTHSGAQGPDWFPDGSKETHRDLYPRFIAFVQQAIDDLKARGYEVTVEGVFWHPGENDTYFHYHKNLGPWMKQLIDRSRTDLKLPHLKWFISEQHEKAIWRNMTVVNEAMNKLAQEDANITVIKTSHLPHQRLHFGTRGTILLGESYATAWAKEGLE